MPALMTVACTCTSSEWAYTADAMPELCRFYGIIIRMYFDEHPPAHFHAYYGDAQAVVRIDTLEVIRGELPRRALVLVAE